MFSSEFIELKTCMDRIFLLRFKLQMFGVPVEEDIECIQ